MESFLAEFDLEVCEKGRKVRPAAPVTYRAYSTKDELAVREDVVSKLGWQDDEEIVFMVDARRKMLVVMPRRVMQDQSVSGMKLYSKDGAAQKRVNVPVAARRKLDISETCVFTDYEVRKSALIMSYSEKNLEV